MNGRPETPTPKVSSIKVDAVTKERVRLAAAFLGVEQGEFVRRLVVEYVQTHKQTLHERVEEARAALLEGDEAVVRYLREGELGPEDFKRAGGGVA